MGWGSYDLRQKHTPQQSTWRSGIKWSVGDRVFIWAYRMKIDPDNPQRATSEDKQVKVTGTITGFEANHKNRPSIKFDPPEPGYRPQHHSLRDWYRVNKVSVNKDAGNTKDD